MFASETATEHFEQFKQLCKIEVEITFSLHDEIEGRILMKCKITNLESGLELSVSGRMSALDVVELKNQLKEASACAQGEVYLNLSAVESLLSVHLGCIFQAKFQHEAQGKKWTIILSDGEVSKSFERMGFKDFRYSSENLLAS